MVKQESKAAFGALVYEEKLLAKLSFLNNSTNLRRVDFTIFFGPVYFQ